MLDKLKLFNKDKDRSKSSKRTSSSSGFSSARSDSSLSLNNDPSTSAISTAPKNKKNDVVNGTNKSSNKNSKVASKAKEVPGLPAPIIKTQSKDKKKNGENNVDVKVQKVPNVKFQQNSQLQQQQFLLGDPRMKPVLRKIEIKPDLKTGLQQPQTKVAQPISTSIPKPMAAIKGTSKAPSRIDETFEAIKMDKSINDNRQMEKTQVVNPLSIHNQLRGQNGHIHASSQSMSDSVHSNNHSNSSESSVIYRPSASDSEFYQQQQQPTRNLIPNRKVDHFNDALLTNGHKFNTIPSKLNGASSSTIGNNQMVSTNVFEEQNKTAQHHQQEASAVVPLRSIMRAYNNQQQQQQQQHVTTLPTRGSRGGQNFIQNGYYDEHHSQGYCSDGDALRKTPIRYTDIENGYLSEGGGGVTNPHFMSIFRNRPQLPTTIAEER